MNWIKVQCEFNWNLRGGRYLTSLWCSQYQQYNLWSRAPATTIQEQPELSCLDSTKPRFWLQEWLGDVSFLFSIRISSLTLCGNQYNVYRTYCGWIMPHILSQRMSSLSQNGKAHVQISGETSTKSWSGRTRLVSGSKVDSTTGRATHCLIQTTHSRVEDIYTTGTKPLYTSIYVPSRWTRTLRRFEGGNHTAVSNILVVIRQLRK